MPQDYDGNPAGGARAPAIKISEPVNADPRNAASVQVPFEKVADFVAWLQAHAGILDDDNAGGTKWTGINEFAGGVNFSRTGDDNPNTTHNGPSAPGGGAITRKLLANGLCGDGVLWRLYGVRGTQLNDHGFEITVNAQWVAAQAKWFSDDVNSWASALRWLAGSETNTLNAKWIAPALAGVPGEWADASWGERLRWGPKHTVVIAHGKVQGGAITISKNVTSVVNVVAGQWRVVVTKVPAGGIAPVATCLAFDNPLGPLAVFCKMVAADTFDVFTRRWNGAAWVVGDEDFTFSVHGDV